MAGAGTEDKTALCAALKEAGSTVLCGTLAAHGINAGGVTGLADLADMGISLVNDLRGAPVPVRTDGRADESFLVSHTDEDDISLCAWAQSEEGSALVGLGLDLVNMDDFEGERGEFLTKVLLTERDLAIVGERWPEEPKLASAFGFSAKEAAFKALAAPLRVWHETHDEWLRFEVRSFELLDAAHEQGTARKGKGKRAMDALGITGIEVFCVACENYLVTFALALK